MPLRSPMPSTVVSTWVAPASSAASALATAHPVSLWPWNSMSQSTAARSAPVSALTCAGVAIPTVSAMPTRSTPSAATAPWMATTSAGSVRKVSSQLKRTSIPAVRTSSMQRPATSRISSRSRPCECVRSHSEVPKRRSTPPTPQSMASATSSGTQRVWVSTVARSPRPARSRHERSACGEATGVVTSMYSTPKSSTARATWRRWSWLKLARANCSPSRRVDSMIDRRRIGMCCVSR